MEQICTIIYRTGNKVWTQHCFVPAGLYWIMLGSVRCFIILLMVNSKKIKIIIPRVITKRGNYCHTLYGKKEKKLRLHMTLVKVLLNWQQVWKVVIPQTLSMIIICLVRCSARWGKMSGALCSDWLPERPRWAHLARSGFPAWPRQEKISWPENESFINQICSGLKVKYNCIRDWWHSRC